MPIKQEQEITSHLDRQNWKARCTRLRQGREVPQAPSSGVCSRLQGTLAGLRSSIHECPLSQQAYSQSRGGDTGGNVPRRTLTVGLLSVHHWDRQSLEEPAVVTLVAQKETGNGS